MKKMVLLIMGLVSALVIGTVTMHSKASNNVGTSGQVDNVRRTQMKVDESGELQITRNELGNEPMGEEGTWTLFFYICASNLEKRVGLSTKDITEILKANTSDKVNIVIETGGTPDWKDKYDIPDDKLQRYLVKDHKLQLIESLPNASMGDEKTFEDFLTWGVQNYPAEHMGVITFGHGRGSFSGICFDPNYDDDGLLPSEIEKAFYNTSKHMTDKFEFVEFYSCLTGVVEYANMLAPYANYQFASQEVISANTGYEFTTPINAIVENPDIDIAELGKVCGDAFIEGTTGFGNALYVRKPQMTFSVIDLKKMDNALVEFNRVAKRLDEYATSIEKIEAIRNAANESEVFGSDEAESDRTRTKAVDMVSFLNNISPYVGDTSAAVNALKEAVAYERHGWRNKGANGLNLAFPMSCKTRDIGLLNTARNLVISPYYLNFLEKLLYYYDDKVDTELANFTSGNWQSSEYYFEETIDYTDNIFVGYSDWNKKVKNTEYFSNVQFDDIWAEQYNKPILNQLAEQVNNN